MRLYMYAFMHAYIRTIVKLVRNIRSLSSIVI